jgi:hypothetical protein
VDAVQLVVDDGEQAARVRALDTHGDLAA